MFTRLSNFAYGNYQIANITSDTEPEKNIALTIHIQKYETECLKLLLGGQLYEELMDNVELENGYWKLKLDADEKWGRLINGCSFEKTADDICFGNNSDSTLFWKGLVTKVAEIDSKEILESLMAPYIFFYWSLHTRTMNLGTGEGRGESKSATQESSKNKRIDAWNEFVQWADYGFTQNEVSLSRFLKNHKGDFNVVSPCLKTMTYYDL